MISKEDYIKRLEKKYGNKVQDIEILEYNGIYKKMTYKCKKCNRIESIQGRTLLVRHSNAICTNCENPLSYRNREKKNQERIKQMFNNSEKSLHFIKTDYKEYNSQLNHKHITVKYYCDRCQQESEVYLKDITNNFFSCRHCGKMARMTKQDFQKWFDLYYKDKFIILNPNEYVNTKSRLHIKCKDCGFIFNPTVTSLKRSKKVLCPKCRQGKSRPELYISDWLTKNNIEFDSEVNFKWLPNHYLRYDFVIFEHKLIIEYDGEQHYSFIPHFHKTEECFKKLQDNDKIKDKLAIENGFSILRIPYTYNNKIKDILSNLFSSTTIPQGSRGKLLEIDSILNIKDEDIV